MRRIFKYQLEPTDRQVKSLPLGSKILSVENQFENIVLYALVDDETCLESSEVRIIVHGTGHDANDIVDYKFLGTVKYMGGELMFHVFCDRLEV